MGAEELHELEGLPQLLLADGAVQHEQLAEHGEAAALDLHAARHIPRTPHQAAPYLRLKWAPHCLHCLSYLVPGRLLQLRLQTIQTRERHTEETESTYLEGI